MKKHVIILLMAVFCQNAFSNTGDKLIELEKKNSQASISVAEGINATKIINIRRLRPVDLADCVNCRSKIDCASVIAMQPFSGKFNPTNDNEVIFTLGITIDKNASSDKKELRRAKLGDLRIVASYNLAVGKWKVIDIFEDPFTLGEVHFRKRTMDFYVKPWNMKENRDGSVCEYSLKNKKKRDRIFKEENDQEDSSTSVCDSIENRKIITDVKGKDYLYKHYLADNDGYSNKREIINWGCGLQMAGNTTDFIIRNDLSENGFKFYFYSKAKNALKYIDFKSNRDYAAEILRKYTNILSISKNKKKLLFVYSNREDLLKVIELERSIF